MKVKHYCGVFFLIMFAAIVTIFLVLAGSYPMHSGVKTFPGLCQKVNIARDEYGIATISGTSRVDVAKATGFLHAQERFFQMDLMRRMAAGELAELFGEAVIDLDCSKRIHRFRNHARDLLSELSDFEKELIYAYTEGVNFGVKALHCKPFEYFLLKSSPKAWQAEDSILVGLGLFFELQDSTGMTDLTRYIIKENLPSSIYNYFVQNGSIWDATLDQSQSSLLSIPSAEDFKYLKNSVSDLDPLQQIDPPIARGSNQWAVGPSITNNHKAILACDMHLNLTVPNIWYRLVISYKNNADETINMYGVSLPGTPLIAIGSNTHIAWGFTNGYVDTTDLIVLDVDPQNSDLYLTKDGLLPFEEKIEEIKIRGKPSHFHKIKYTIWGPVLSQQNSEKPMALRWIAHDKNCFNLQLINLEIANSVQAAFECLHNIQLPVLNFMAVDREGHIGWSLVGGIPKREGYQPGLPVSFTKGDKKWVGMSQKTDYPFIIDPPQSRLWTANNRVIDNPTWGRDYLNSIRAYQIKQRLFSKSKFTIEDMYSIQLDDEAIFFNRWFELLKSSLDFNKLKHRQLALILGQWDHHCSASSKGYFWIRAFREKVAANILTTVMSPCLNKCPDLNFSLIDFEDSVYQMAVQKPAYLVDQTGRKWEDRFVAIIDELLEDNAKSLLNGDVWGKFNMASIQHPLSRAISFSSFLIDMPKNSIGGDYFVPKVSGPSVGASVRMVISPGDEKNGIMNVPCGQSGHPLSKHYRSQHRSWVEGTPRPFMPGSAKHLLTLKPAS